MKKTNNPSFEDTLRRLEEISALLESETVGLDEALNLYEEGITLSKICMEALKNAELRITELRKNVGEISTTSEDNLDD